MLKEILTTKSCAECRLCCVFDSTDTWELPILEAENITAVLAVKPDAVIENGTFTAPKLSDSELFACPVLGEMGCMLPREKRPFDCRIWPFRMMKGENGKTVIAVSDLCESMAKYSDEELCAFLDKGLGEKIFVYAENHPAHIKPMTKGYRVLRSR